MGVVRRARDVHVVQRTLSRRRKLWGGAAAAVVVAAVLYSDSEHGEVTKIRNDETGGAESTASVVDVGRTSVPDSGPLRLGRRASSGQDAGPEFGGQRTINAVLGRVLVSDPSTFLGTSQVRSVVRNGQPGLRLLELDPSCGAAAIGVSTGDVLMYVNGSALWSIDDVTRPASWDSFAEFGEGALFLLRGGRALTIDYAIDDPHWVAASD